MESAIFLLGCEVKMSQCYMMKRHCQGVHFLKLER